MTHAYSEEHLVELPAIGLFGELGWTTVSALEELLGSDGTLGRETKGEVVLVSRLRAALAVPSQEGGLRHGRRVSETLLNR